MKHLHTHTHARARETNTHLTPSHIFSSATLLNPSGKSCSPKTSNTSTETNHGVSRGRWRLIPSDPWIRPGFMRSACVMQDLSPVNWDRSLVGPRDVDGLPLSACLGFSTSSAFAGWWGGSQWVAWGLGEK